MANPTRAVPRAGLLTLVLATCYWLAACHDSTPSPPPRARSVIGPAGGVVTGAGGAAVGIPQGVLSSEVSLTIDVVPAPSEPLPAGLPARGDVYRLTPSRAIAAAGPRDGLVVGLPVPAGGDPARLRALLATGPGEELPGSDWSFLPSFLDTVHGLVLARLLSLDAVGTVVRLVEDAEATTPASRPAGPRARAAAAGDPVAFQVELLPPRPPPSAGATAFYETQLNLALARHLGAGFSPPVIETVPSGLSLNPPQVETPAALLYRATVQAFHPPAGGGPLSHVCEASAAARAGGEYRPATRELALCAYSTAAEMQDPSSVAGMIATTFHEMFHAVQAGYLGQPPAEEAKYFKEATAVMAGAWGPRATDEAVRDLARDRRLVDEPLTKIDGQAPYNAQDFWVGIAGAHALTFPAVTRAFLERGSVAPAQVDVALAGASFGSTLAAEYRRFVRAQSTDPATCVAAIGSAVSLGSVAAGEAGVTGIPAPHALGAGPLSTQALELQVSNAGSRPFHLDLALDGDWALAEAGGASPAVVTELRADASASITCATTPDLAFTTHRVTVPPAGTTFVYVLGVNGHHDREMSGHVAFAKEPFRLVGIEGPPTLVFNTQGTYLLHWSGAPTFPVTVRTRVTACSLDTCTTVPQLTVPTLASPQPFPLHCDGSGPAGSFTIEATMSDAGGEETNPVSVTVGCVE